MSSGISGVCHSVCKKIELRASFGDQHQKRQDIHKVGSVLMSLRAFSLKVYENNALSAQLRRQISALTEKRPKSK